MSIPIIIDTDPGVDDFFCIALGCSFKEVFDLKALTTIGGNHLTDVTTRNALDILYLFDREDVDVARGEDKYLVGEFGEPVAKFHGANGLGDVEIKHTSKKAVELKAYEKIYEVAKELNGELVLVTVGPLTNIGTLLLKHPDVKPLIKKILIMGGTTGPGNITPYAEANINHDYLAADLVFKSGIPLEMVGLNVTHQAPLSLELFKTFIDDVDEEIKRVMLGLVEFREDKIFHDAITIGTMINDYCVFKDAYVYIETKDKEHLGQTVCDFESKNPNCKVAVEIDANGYYSTIKEMINKYKRK